MIASQFQPLIRVLEATVEQLILMGLTPKALIDEVISHSLWFSEKEIADSALELIAKNDALSKESARWAAENESWHSAFPNEDVDLDSYFRDSRAHDEAIKEHQDSIESSLRRAGMLSTAAHQASLLGLLIADQYTPSAASRAEIVEAMLQRILGNLALADSECNPERLQIILRSLIGFGNFEAGKIEPRVRGANASRSPLTTNPDEDDDIPF